MLRVAATGRALLAVAIGVAVLVGYVWLLSTQGPDGGGSREPFFVGYWSALAVGGLVGGWTINSRPVIAQPILVGVTTGYLATGFLALFSVGAPLLVAGVLTISALGPVGPWRLVNAFAIVLPLALLVVGLGVTR